MQIECEKNMVKKTLVCNPEIYEIPSTKSYNKSLWLIDTFGLWDTRGIEYNNKIKEDIQNLFDNPKINNLKAICLIFKAW